MTEWAELRRRAQAGKDAAPRLYRVHRRLSIHVTRALVRTAISADAVSLAMMVAAGAGTLLMAAADLRVNGAGAALLYLGFLLDKVDGELARVRGTPSVRGILLDRFHHRVVEPALFAAAAAHAYRHDTAPGVLVAAAACMLFANTIEENQQLAPYILHKHLREGGRVPPAPAEHPWLRRLGRALRPLKALRMHIVVLPLVMLAYVGEAASGWPLTRAYLEGSAVTLGVYLAFQCVDYAACRLELETRQVAASFARAHTRDPGSWESLSEATPGPEAPTGRPSQAATRPAPRPRRASESPHHPSSQEARTR